MTSKLTGRRNPFLTRTSFLGAMLVCLLPYSYAYAQRPYDPSQVFDDVVRNNAWNNNVVDFGKKGINEYFWVAERLPSFAPKSMIPQGAPLNMGSESGPQPPTTLPNTPEIKVLADEVLNGTTQPYRAQPVPSSSPASDLKSGPVVPLAPRVVTGPIAPNAACGADNVCRLAPSPAPASTSVPVARPEQPRFVTNNTFAPPPIQPAPKAATPSGISLTRAAAMRMNLSLDLEGAYVSNGRIILSGQKNSAQSMDAALFFTALRLACGSGDPYLSLDPDNGGAWDQQGQRAAGLVMEQFSREFESTAAAFSRGRQKFVDGLNIYTISARRDYAQFWATTEPQFPDLKTRLIFRPEWLRSTRFGEILYKADVLLKELTTGVSLLQAGSNNVRADKVEGYIPSSNRSVATTLLSGLEGTADKTGNATWRGHRLWFDLMAQTEQLPNDLGTPDGFAAPLPAADVGHKGDKSNTTSASSALRKVLNSRGYLTSHETPIQNASVGRHGDILDLSNVFPRMFVRRFDSTAGRDLPGHDSALDALSDDVNIRTDRYVEAYEELRALQDIFRAYVAAIGIVKNESGICLTTNKLPLLPSEKTDQPLPEYHPSEIFITHASFVHSSRRQRTLSPAMVTSINGGIALRGKYLFENGVHIDLPTAVTQAISQELASGVQQAAWSGSSNREFITFTVDWDEPPSSLAEVRPTSPATVQEVIQTEELLRSEDARRSLEAYQALEKQRQESEQREIEARKEIEIQATKARADELAAVPIEERNRLKAKYGNIIEGDAGRALVPYAVASLDAHNNQSLTLEQASLKLLWNWKSVFEQAGRSASEIAMIERSGFKGRAYKNEANGEVIVALASGPAVPSHMPRIVDFWGAQDIQFKAASDLIFIVKQKYPNASIVLTGLQGGGQLAVYAGEQVRFRRVITFDSEGSPMFASSSNPSRVSILVHGGLASRASKQLEPSDTR